MKPDWLVKANSFTFSWIFPQCFRKMPRLTFKYWRPWMSLGCTSVSLCRWNFIERSSCSLKNIKLWFLIPHWELFFFNHKKDFIILYLNFHSVVPICRYCFVKGPDPKTQERISLFRFCIECLWCAEGSALSWMWAWPDQQERRSSLSLVSVRLE